ncbi:MAG: radical SAM protein [Candidatus Paceibacterota bacterium]|jgi:MoaA/NifB/PqqE/SkfB family radical SAM enzyme
MIDLDLIKVNDICHCSDNKPKLLQVKMNNRCNGNCWFCIDRNNYDARIIDVDKMAEAIISETEYKTIDITGGEPFLDFDILLELLKKIRPHKNEIILNTNGTLISKENIYQLNGLVDELRIALHHYDETKNFEIVKARLSFLKLNEALKYKKFKATFNMVITNAMEDDKEHFIEKLTVLCHKLNVDAVRISELKYVGINNGYEEYDKQHIKAFDFFKKLNVIKNKNSEELITNGCIDVFQYNGVEFHLKRLCGFKIKSKKQTFKVVYSNGEKANDWIYEP